MSESNITTLYKGKFVLVDLVDETIELTVENNVYSYSESYELLDELQKSCDIIKKEKSETYSQQMQDELEPIDPYYLSYPNHLPRLIKKIEDRNNLINNKETEVEQDTDDRM
jgi:hypothetical protein|tara:strand:+ start:364 stop:699 length:336 start_codon:yes stop_codon:yes gene_type:complete